jgi:2,3-bisphosphoglycerate-independent phosphoglycerate mutase
MYKGVARLAGMDVLDLEGNTLEDEFAALEKHWDSYDFFYLHIKQTDTCGENGDFMGKVRAIEAVDAQMPRLLALKPDVVIVGGDHSTPSIMQAHSWHPVPVMLYSRHARCNGIREFGEGACARGSLGILPAKEIMPIALAHAGRVAKYGA